MNADEQNDETPEQPAGDQPEPEQPAAEEPAAEEPVAEAPPAEEPAPAEESAPEAQEPGSDPVPPQEDSSAQEGSDPTSPAEETLAEETPAEETPAEETPAEEPPAEPAAAPPAPSSDAPARPSAPGADLEPIALEPERELSAEEKARLEAEAEEQARREAEQASTDEPLERSTPQVELAKDALIQATGKRKSSIARVVIRRGGGILTVNDKSVEEYFPRPALQTVVRSPLVTAGYEETVDVRVRVHGGGIAGQAGAVRHGIARALTEIDPELRGELKRRGLLTRDARRKERKKAGLKKARKRPQFSKR